MRGWRTSKIGPVMLASVAFSTALAAQAKPAAQDGGLSNACLLASNTEFQQTVGVDPRIGIIPDDPVATDMSWGSHCDYSGGSIDLFQGKSPEAQLERLLGLTDSPKTSRVPVQGLGQRAFFTVVYPDDEYRRRGFLAVFTGPHLVGFSLDADDDPVEATRPKLERLAKLVLPRVK